MPPHDHIPPPPPTHQQQQQQQQQDNDGLADRLINAVDGFLVSLFTQRALCILPAQIANGLQVEHV